MKILTLKLKNRLNDKVKWKPIRSLVKNFIMRKSYIYSQTFIEYLGFSISESGKVSENMGCFWAKVDLIWHAIDKKTDTQNFYHVKNLSLFFYHHHFSVIEQLIRCAGEFHGLMMKKRGGGF
jgi:hypothetical protein